MWGEGKDSKSSLQILIPNFTPLAHVKYHSLVLSSTEMAPSCLLPRVTVMVRVRVRIRVRIRVRVRVRVRID
jgi:hypothetical protein